MAIVMIDGFDFYTASQITTRGWSQAVTSMQTGRFGSGQAMRLPAGTTSKTLPGSYTELYLGFAWKPTQSVVASDVCVLTTAGAVNAFRVRLVASGADSVLAILNSGGTVIATGTTKIQIGSYHYVEAHCLINGASGSCSLRLDGFAEIADTTGNFGSTAVTSIGFTGNNQSDIDDLYVADTSGAAPRNTYLGDVRVTTLYPTSDGAHSQWTPSTGSAHWSLVDETTPNDDTDYVSDGTPGDYDTYGFSNLPTSGTVLGVQTNVWARKDDAAARQIAPVIRQAGTDTDGATVTLSSAYQLFSQIFNQDPTNTDWTSTNVNADEYGVKVVA